MIDNVLARLLVYARYRSRSLANNMRQFKAAAGVIEELVAVSPEPVLRGRRPVAAPPQAVAFAGRGTFRYPIFGRLDSRGAYALVAFHLQRHVPQIRRSSEINGQS